MTGGTGRSLGELGRRTRRVVYGDLTAAEIAAEMPLMVQVDRAHLVMLAEQKLVPPESAGALLRCIDELAGQRFAPLASRPAPRGLYLMYEGYLIELLGADVGGVLHTARSRNDLKATMTALRLRGSVLELASQAVRLEAVLLSRARAYRDVVMPVHTHFQAAMPVSYGYYLLGVALAVGRDVDALRAAADGLSACPLGAGAVAGSDLPIDPDRTARLLGFAEPAPHALDAVASRDVALRVLGAATGLTVTLSRLATDLQLWSTAEFGFVDFPDRLVGGSSAMPQKRNAFLLEHVKAKPAEALGAWAAAAAAMAGTPFTNSIEVGTEAVGDVWPGMRAVEEAVLLCQVLVLGARPNPARMVERAEQGFTTATAVADRLVGRGVPFRTAHRMVGDAVRRAIEAGTTRLEDVGLDGTALDDTALDDTALDDTALDGTALDGIARDTTVAAVVRSLAHGGGPGAFAGIHVRAVTGWRGHLQWHQDWRRSVADADAELTAAVAALREAQPMTLREAQPMTPRGQQP